METTKRKVARFKFEYDGVGGFHASYGYGVVGTEWDAAVMGYGRSAHEAAGRAIDDLYTAYGCHASDDMVEASCLDTSEKDVQDIEGAIMDEICRERFGMEYARCSLAHQQEAETYFADMVEPVECGVVLWVRFDD